MSEIEGRVHLLKCTSAEWMDIRAGRKAAEFRRDDRGFAKRDILVLAEVDDETREPTGRELWTHVSHLCRLDKFGAPGFVLLSLGDVRLGSPSPQQLREHFEEIPF